MVVFFVSGLVVVGEFFVVGVEGWVFLFLVGFGSFRGFGDFDCV